MILQFDLMPVHFYNYNLLECPKRITLSSIGGATLWKTRLGSYNLMRYYDTANATYEHELKNGNFLYKAKTGVWVVRQTQH